MKRCLVALHAFLCFALFFPLSALAQSDESGKYDAGSFTITPPEGWILVSGSLGEKELAKLPENIREHYNARNTDVLFMNIAGLDQQPTQGFKDSLNVVTVAEQIPLTDDLVKELTDVLKQQYKGMFDNFASSSMEKTKIGARDVFEVKGSYTILNYSIMMRQVFIPLSNASLVMTCTYESSHEDTVAELCDKAIRSLEVK